MLHKVVLAFCDWYQVQTATTYVMYHLRFGKKTGSTWGVLLHYARPWDIDTYVSTSDVRNFEIPSKTVHTVSFDWFLSGLVWILNLEFCLLKLLIFCQKSLWNIRSRLKSSTFSVFEPVFIHVGSKSSFFAQKASILIKHS